MVKYKVGDTIQYNYWIENGKPYTGTILEIKYFQYVIKMNVKIPYMQAFSILSIDSHPRVCLAKKYYTNQPPSLKERYAKV